MKIISIFITLFLLCVSCGKKSKFFNATEKEFGEFGRELALNAEPVAFDSVVIAPHSIHYVDGYLLFKHRGECPYFFSLYDLKTNKFISEFLRRGRGKDEFFEIVYNDEYEIQNGETWLYLNDINARSILRFNMTGKVEQGVTEIELLNEYDGFRDCNHVIDDSTFFVSIYSEVDGDMKVFYRKYSNKSGTYVQDMDFATIENCPEITTMPLGRSEYLRPDKKKVASAMMFMNRLNIFDPDDPKHNITLTPEGSTPVSPSEIWQMDDISAQAYSYYNATRATQDYIFSLFVGRPYMERPAKAEMHVFNWDGEPLFKINFDEYLVSFCVDPDNKVMYAVDNVENIYRYDLSEVMK